MKIKTIETFTRDQLSLVRVTTEDDSSGFGQVAPFHADIAATVLHRQVAPHVLGAEINSGEDVAALTQRVVEANYKFPWSYVCRALAGVDTALWDLLGKRAGKSVCQLLGGKRQAVAAYGSSMRRDTTPPEEAQRLARLKDEKGFGAFKIRIGKVCGHDEDQWPGRTEQLVPAVRKALGDEVALLVDANSCYSPAKAIQVGRTLEDNGVIHLEEPCPYWELEWTAQVAAELKVPVAGGEQDNDLAQWRRMIAMGAVDIVQPDVCYVGGLSRALRVAEMAACLPLEGRQAGPPPTSRRAGRDADRGGSQAAAPLPCVPHSANLSLVSVFTLHLLGAIPNAGPHMEFSIEPNDWARQLYDPPLEVRDGKVAIPQGPGWGVTINPRWLASASRQVSTLD